LIKNSQLNCNIKQIHYHRMQIGEKILHIVELFKLVVLKLRNKDYKFYKERIVN
jgi:hypothetical protein